MNQLINTIQIVVEEAVSKSINNFLKKVVNKWDDIDIKELTELWNDDINNIKLAETKSSSPSKKNKIEKNEKNEEECPYIFTKGEKEGTTCGSKTKSNCKY